MLFSPSSGKARAFVSPVASVQGEPPSDLKLPHLQWILHVVLFWTEGGVRTQGLCEFLGGAQPEPRLVSGPWSLAERQCNLELFCSAVFKHRLFLFASMCDGCEAHSSWHFHPCRALSPSSCLAPHPSLCGESPPPSLLQSHLIL